MKDRGVTVLMPPTQRQGEGIRLTVILDPDAALRLSLRDGLRK